MDKNAVKDVVSVHLLLAGSSLLQDQLSAAGAAAEDALTFVEVRVCVGKGGRQAGREGGREER